MNNETKEIVNYRLKRARETLEDAQKLFQNDSLYSSVNRIYYSMFYSVNALLLTGGLASSKHNGVKALFLKEFVNKGKVRRNYGRFYSEMFKRRQTSDYKDLVELMKEDVKEWLEKAEEFVNEIEKIISKIIVEQK